MCGICGLYFSRSGKPVQSDWIAAMCAKIVHRGPDDEGMYVDGPLGIGMRRLSIIDLDSGKQPIFNEDGTVGVVFNGEIYNYVELRRELLAQGHQFKTQSDTEVLVHLYEEHGIDFPQKLNGMFGIALWDARNRRLVLVRDRLGVKPLYYAWTDDGLVFGSELKCLAQIDGVPKRLDHESLLHYFTLGYIPNPASIYRDVRQMPPASRLVVERDTLKLDQYWHLESRIDRSKSRTECCEQLHELLADAVRCRMRSDVPLGAFLSGGVDSSIAVALMAQQSSSPVRTFYIDFEEPGFSERPYARAVAKRYGTDHHELFVRPSAAAILDDLVDHFDEPFGDSSAIPTYYVSQLARQHVTVVLAGDAGDESFGGYNRYKDILRRRRLPDWVRGGLGGVGNALHCCLPRTAPGRRYLRSLGLSRDEFYCTGTSEMEARELLSPDVLSGLNGAAAINLMRPHLDAADRNDPLAPYAYLDLHRYLPDDILTKVDRTSMAHSLEVRGPFLDYRVVELAATIPYDWKIDGNDTKVILKETFAADLPPEVLEPRKRGFSIPLGEWLKGELRGVLDDAIHDSDIASSGLFRMKEIQGLAREHWSGVRNRKAQLWRYLFFVRWWQLNRAHLASV